MVLTRAQAIAEHRKMWQWIAEETAKLKRKVDKWEYLIKDGLTEQDVNSECFCCEYARQKGSYEYPDCSHCPLDWGSSVKEVMCTDKDVTYDFEGLYEKWRSAEFRDWETAAKYARIIAELPERAIQED